MNKVEQAPKSDLRLILFKGKGVRQIFHNNEWFFSVIDVIKVLSGSSRPSQYWNDLKKQLADQEAFNELSANIGKLPMPSADGRMRVTDVANMKTVLRIIQSISTYKSAGHGDEWINKRLKTILYLSNHFNLAQ